MSGAQERIALLGPDDVESKGKFLLVKLICYTVVWRDIGNSLVDAVASQNFSAALCRPANGMPSP